MPALTPWTPKRTTAQHPRIQARLEAKAQDVWIGLYWEAHPMEIEVWLCLIPFFPLHIRWDR